MFRHKVSTTGHGKSAPFPNGLGSEQGGGGGGGGGKNQSKSRFSTGEIFSCQATVGIDGNP